MKREERAREVLKRLRRTYPDADCALDHEGPFQLLAATILSAQCTDARVNMVTPELFRRYPRPGDMAQAKTEELEEVIRSTGFYRNKAKSLLGMAGRITDDHGGQVPAAMDELVKLPGVARKTANVVLGTAFGQNEGVVVDTHVSRLSQRMGLTRETDPEKIERDLMKLFPRQEWTNLSHRLITHGRLVCDARRPRCAQCVMGPDACAAYEPDEEKWKKGRAKAGAAGKKVGIAGKKTAAAGKKAGVTAKKAAKKTGRKTAKKTARTRRSS